MPPAAQPLALAARLDPVARTWMPGSSPRLSGSVLSPVGRRPGAATAEARPRGPGSISFHLAADPEERRTLAGRARVSARPHCLGHYPEQPRVWQLGGPRSINRRFMLMLDHRVVWSMRPWESDPPPRLSRAPTPTIAWTIESRRLTADGYAKVNRAGVDPEQRRGRGSPTPRDWPSPDSAASNHGHDRPRINRRLTVDV